MGSAVLGLVGVCRGLQARHRPPLDEGERSCAPPSIRSDRNGCSTWGRTMGSSLVRRRRRSEVVVAADADELVLDRLFGSLVAEGSGVVSSRCWSICPTRRRRMGWRGQERSSLAERATTRPGHRIRRDPSPGSGAERPVGGSRPGGWPTSVARWSSSGSVPKTRWRSNSPPTSGPRRSTSTTGKAASLARRRRAVRRGSVKSRSPGERGHCSSSSPDDRAHGSPPWSRR